MLEGRRAQEHRSLYGSRPGDQEAGAAPEPCGRVWLRPAAPELFCTLCAGRQVWEFARADVPRLSSSPSTVWGRGVQHGEEVCNPGTSEPSDPREAESTTQHAGVVGSQYGTMWMRVCWDGGANVLLSGGSRWWLGSRAVACSNEDKEILEPRILGLGALASPSEREFSPLFPHQCP